MIFITNVSKAPRAIYPSSSNDVSTTIHLHKQSNSLFKFLSLSCILADVECVPHTPSMPSSHMPREQNVASIVDWKHTSSTAFSLQFPSFHNFPFGLKTPDALTIIPKGIAFPNTFLLALASVWGTHNIPCSPNSISTQSGGVTTHPEWCKHDFMPPHCFRWVNLECSQIALFRITKALFPRVFCSVETMWRCHLHERPCFRFESQVGAGVENAMKWNSFQCKIAKSEAAVQLSLINRILFCWALSFILENCWRTCVCLFSSFQCVLQLCCCVACFSISFIYWQIILPGIWSWSTFMFCGECSNSGPDCCLCHMQCCLKQSGSHETAMLKKQSFPQKGCCNVELVLEFKTNKAISEHVMPRFSNCLWSQPCSR